MANPPTHDHEEHHEDQLGEIGSQESMSVVALSVTLGLLLLMVALMVVSRFM